MIAVFACPLLALEKRDASPPFHLFPLATEQEATAPAAHADLGHAVPLWNGFPLASLRPRQRPRL
jgi:hypothetical protein